MNDKLPFLKKIAQKKGIIIEIVIKDSEADYNKELKQYMTKISLAQSYIRNMNINIQKLQIIKSDLPSAIADKEKDFSDQIDKLINNSLEMQQMIKHIIDSNFKLIKDNEKNSDLLEQEKRIISNLQGCLIKSFQNAVTDFQMIQSEIKNIKQNTTVRNAEIVIGRKLENKEIESVVNDPTIIQDMLKSKFLDPASNKFAAALSDIDERHNDLLKLEKSVNQVHQMFLQLAALVNLQGEIIDNISENIATAKQDVLAGEEDVLKSKKNMQSARKKKCIIIIIVVVVLLVIILPTLGIKVFSV